MIDGKQKRRFFLYVRHAWEIERALARRSRRRTAALGVTAILVAVALAPELFQSMPRPTAGSYVVGNIRAPYAFSVVDEQATAEAQARAVAEAPPVFDYDPNVGQEAAQRLGEAFEFMRDLAVPPDGSARAGGDRKRARELKEQTRAALSAARPAFAAKLQTDLADEDFALLAAAKFDVKISAAIVQWLWQIYDKYISYDVEARLRPHVPDNRLYPAAIELRVDGQSKAEVIASAEQLLTPPQAANYLEAHTPASLADQPFALRDLLRRIAVAQIHPNLAFNAAATAEVEQRAADAVAPVTYAFEKNQLIIGDGQIVTRKTVVALGALRSRAAVTGIVRTILGVALLAFAMAGLPIRAANLNLPHAFFRDRDVYLIGTMLLATVLGLRLAGWFDSQLANLFPAKPEWWWLFLFPFAAPAMLVRLMTRFEIALVFTAVLALFASFAVDAPPAVGAVLFLVALAGVQAMGAVETRRDVWRGAFRVGLTAAALALVLAILRPGVTPRGALDLALAGMIGAALSAMLTMGFAPLLEWAFGYMTNISLLELANYESPVLKQLARLAPGTFHHSIALGSLVEAAAEAIGANALLVRVGAMHHDIGKTRNPRYFVENQQGGENPHDKIASPEESARIVIAHVADGVSLARENGLPQDIIDFIEQHHGTRLAAFFYEKAKTIAEAKGETAPEEPFRYPGPKPQSKETALLMICDTVEARSRTMDDRDPQAMQGMIRQTIAYMREEGQFDESPLTESDCRLLVHALTDVILGMRHGRVKYPDPRRRFFRKARG